MTVYFVTLALVTMTSAIANHFRSSARPTAHGGRLQYGGGSMYRFQVLLTALILIAISSLRYNVGTDYLPYSRTYHTRAASFFSDLLHYREPGWGFLCAIGHLFSQDYAMGLFLAALLTIALNVRTISRYSDSFFFGLLLYLLIGAWHNSFNGVRQYLAAAVLFAGHGYMLERKLFKYLLVVFIASLFHTTALVMVPVFFLAGRRITFRTILLIIISTVVIRYSYDFLFSIMNYLKGQDQSAFDYMQQDVNIFRIMVTFPPIIMGFLTPKDFRDKPENAFYLSLLIVNAGFMVGTANSAYLARVGIYTEIYAVLAIPRFVRAFNRTIRDVLTGATLLLYTVFWAYEISIRETLRNFQWIFNR